MKKSFICVFLTILFFSCSNAVHDFIPPQSKEIISFGLKTDKMEDIPCAEYKNGENIMLTVPANTDISKMIPVIKVSDGACVLPITLEYLFAAFPSMDLLTLAVKLQEIFSSNNVKEWLFEFIRQNPDFKIPSLTLPIDFSRTVHFLVLSGRATTRFYQVSVQKEVSNENNNNNTPGETPTPENHTMCTVTFNSNNGENKQYTQTFISEKEQNLNQNCFFSPAFTFVGWNTNADGSGTYYSDGQAITITSDMALYAQWSFAGFSDEPVEEFFTHTVTFNSNNDVNQEYTQTFISGKEQKLNLNCFYYIAYIFNGWNTKADGSGTSYTDGQAVALKDDMTLYAQWTYDESVEVYTLTFDSNNGENRQYTQKFVNGKYQYLNQNCFIYSTYEFSGWNTKADGSGTYYSDGQSITILSDTTLYAQWEFAAQKDILLFLVSGQVGDAEITENTVSFSVDAETDISSLFPVVKVSDGATVLPLTQKYLLSLNLTFEQMLSFYSGYSTSTNIEEYVAKWLRENDIKLPQSLSIPIDFRETVMFAVVAANKTVKLYTINCNVLKIDPALEKLAFTKYTNPGLMKDSDVWERTHNNYISESVYPVEWEDFALIPEFNYYGDSVTYKIGNQAEAELISGVTPIPFTESNKTCTITVYKGSNKAVYTVTTKYTFDPDTIRSITDFRFYKNKNANIKDTAMAAIFNEGEKGYITVTVNYDGAKPDVLIPTFLSPGTVSVNRVTQQSGTSSQDFSAPIEYLCVSKNKMFSRLYTVNVEYNKTEPATALINSFSFPAYLNKEITHDVQGIIDHENATIDIEVPYSGSNEPYKLMPLFSGTGKIYVEGITQSSGYSIQDFSNNVYYRVVSSDDESVSKQYVVRTSYRRDSDSLCEITSFGFKRSSQNAKLDEDINATVTQRTKEIFAYLPYGSGSRDGLLAATFEAQGDVYVDDVLQNSGISLNDFSKPVIYKVVSANGEYSKEYTVTVQETGNIIFVNNELTTGFCNGSTWDDAYMTLEDAVEKASNVATQLPCEIWLCDNGTEYVALDSGNKLDINGTITIKGGFAGTETSASQRDASKKTKIKGFSFDPLEKACALNIEDIEMYSDGSENYNICMENKDDSSNIQTVTLKNVALSGNTKIAVSGNKNTLTLTNVVSGENTQIAVTGNNCTLNITNSTLNKNNIQLDVGTFNTTDSTFDNCTITENALYASLSKSTFNHTRMTLAGDTQIVKNCEFTVDHPEGDLDKVKFEDVPVAFNAVKTEISDCNFIKGTILCMRSTFINNMVFGDDAWLAIKDLTKETESTFEAKNCEQLNIDFSLGSNKNVAKDSYGITGMTNIKIVGKSPQEKCRINSRNNEFVFRITSYCDQIEKIHLENVATNHSMTDPRMGRSIIVDLYYHKEFTDLSKNIQLYINNCDLPEITCNASAVYYLSHGFTGGIYNSTFEGLGITPESDFIIENCTVAGTPDSFYDGGISCRNRFDSNFKITSGSNFSNLKVTFNTYNQTEPITMNLSVTDSTGGIDVESYNDDINFNKIYLKNTTGSLNIKGEYNNANKHFTANVNDIEIDDCAISDFYCYRYTFLGNVKISDTTFTNVAWLDNGNNVTITDSNFNGLGIDAFKDFSIKNSTLESARASTEFALDGSLHLKDVTGKIDIANCDISANDYNSGVIAKNCPAAVTISKTPINSAWLIASFDGASSVSITDSVFTGVYGISLQDIDNFSMKGVTLNLGYDILPLNGNMCDNVKIEDCNFRLNDGGTITNQGTMNFENSTVTISNTKFDFPIVFGNVINGVERFCKSVKITNGCSMPRLHVIADEFTADDLAINNTAKFYTATDNTQVLLNGLDLSIRGKATVTNSNIYSKYNYAVNTAGAGTVTIKDTKLDSDGTATVNAASALVLNGATIARPTAGSAIVSTAGKLDVTNNIFDDKNTPIGDYYTVDKSDMGYLTFTNNKLTKTSSNSFAIKASNGLVKDSTSDTATSSFTDTYKPFISTKDSCCTTSLKIQNEILTGSSSYADIAYKCIFRTNDKIIVNHVQECTISPYDTAVYLHCDIVSKCTFEKTAAGTASPLQMITTGREGMLFIECTFKGINLTVNKHETEFSNCTFNTGVNKTINHDTNHSVTQVYVLNSEFNGSANVIVQGQKNPRARVIYMLQNCTFGYYTMKRQSTDEILIPIGSTSPTYTDF